jgi:hypothetical protein
MKNTFEQEDLNSSENSSSKRVLVIDLNSDDPGEIEKILKGLASDKRIEILRYLTGRSCGNATFAYLHCYYAH